MHFRVIEPGGEELRRMQVGDRLQRELPLQGAGSYGLPTASYSGPPVMPGIPPTYSGAIPRRTYADTRPDDTRSPLPDLYAGIDLTNYDF